MAAALPITLRALADAASSGVGTAVDCTLLTPTTDASSATRVPRWAAKLVLDLAAIGAGNTLLVEIETSDDPLAAAWRWLCTEEHVAALEEPLEIYIGGLQRYVRARWTLSGPSPTARFGLTGEAHTVYCRPKDIITDAIVEYAIDQAKADKRVRACVLASTEAEGYVASAYTTPLLGWGEDLTEKTALLAAPKLLNGRGRHPESPDEGVYKAADNALVHWFNRVANGQLKPPGIVDTTPEVFEGGSVVVSSPSRGWR
jgi:hypothetical protein